ncbi:MAG: Trk family potassium uptake protein [Oscillibacter sp.]|jgi:trk system potassium uptake protein TrkH|nr:Trk family potassium uptake protein [Oscillibacter sp.]
MRHSLRLNAFQVLATGLALVILTGGVLLSLPIASKGEPIPFLNAVFTSGSASCVTGLVLYDTYSQFTVFGQVVIMLLIQIGGLGFMMVASLVSILIGRRIGLYERSLLMQSVGALKIGGVVRLTKHTLVATAIFEGAGTLLLATWFCPKFGFGQGLWMALFHAVSAFCNAGFDIMGIVKPGTSFMTAADVPVVNLTIMMLIIVGGLGFFLWDDLFRHRLHFREYRLHTKLVLTGTAILLVGGTLGFYFLERGHAFAGVSQGQKWLMAAFQSVTPRTAGFNTVDLKALSPGGTFLTILLMFVGAGSGSTGGGIKVNTIAVVVLCILAYAKRKDSISVFHRRVDDETTREAFSAVGLYLAGCLVGCMILCAQGFLMEDSIFEVFSAMGTVGLTRGITPHLPVLSKLTIILLMYFGRLGSLSVAMAVTGSRQNPRVHNVSEKVLIG